MFTDKSKIKWNQKLTALRAVRKGGGGMPQEGNRTGLQEVWREESGLQLGGAAEKDGEKSREGGREAANIVRAGG